MSLAILIIRRPAVVMISLQPVVLVLLVLFISLIKSNDPEQPTRFKRIIVGNGSAALPPRPLPIGNLSSALGEADCYLVNSRFYCISQFLASFKDSNRYCREENMKLLYLENEEEHEYLFDFMGSNYRSSGKLLHKTDFVSEEDYSAYVFDNISPGMLVKCVSVCGSQIRPSVDEGRVLDYEDREYIGLAVKVQWKTGVVRWYPAQNLIMGAFRSQNSNNNRRPTEGVLTVEEEIFEPGDKVRFRPPPDMIVDNSTALQQTQQSEIGIISDLDFSGGIGLVHFPSNRGWRGPLASLEIVDKRKGLGTYWTSGRRYGQHNWLWTSNNERLTYTNWSTEEKHSVQRGNCLQIKYHKYGKWSSANCAGRNYFICKKKIR